MRAILMHVKKFRSEIVEESTRPVGIISENVPSPISEINKGVVAFFCVEKKDNEKMLKNLFLDICEIAIDVGADTIMVCPFGHLSKNIARPEKSFKYYRMLCGMFDKTKYKISKSPFGYHKTLLIDMLGHPGAVRYREYS